MALKAYCGTPGNVLSLRNTQALSVAAASIACCVMMAFRVFTLVATLSTAAKALAGCAITARRVLTLGETLGSAAPTSLPPCSPV